MLSIPPVDSNLLRYETISDLMALQDQIESFQKTVFSHFRHSTNNECRISALVPLVKESWGIYRFITSMLRAMFRSEPCYHRHNALSSYFFFQEQMTKMCWSHYENDIFHSTIIFENSIMNAPIWSTWQALSTSRNWVMYVFLFLNLYPKRIDGFVGTAKPVG